MDNDQKPKLRTKYPDRVTLSSEALTRLGAWMHEVAGHLKGNRVTRNDLVNFLILSRPPHLSEQEISELAKRNFDQIRFTEWALQQLKEARAQGKEVSLAEIVNGMVPTKPKVADDAPPPKLGK